MSKGPRERPYSRQELVREIAKETHLRTEVVALVLKRFEDLAMEDLVNFQQFPLQGFFTLHGYDVKASQGPNGESLPPQRRFRPRLSRRLSVLMRYQREELQGMPFFINRDTWRGALQWLKTAPTKRAPVPPKSELRETEALLDEFLADDYED